MSKNRLTPALLATLLIASLLTGCTSMNKQDAYPKNMVGIIAALESDVAQIMSAMTVDATEEVGDITYHIGTVGDQHVVVAQSGIGKIRPTTCATVMITHFGVQCIIFTGIAGATTRDVQLLDVVISTNVVMHDYGSITPQGFVWRATQDSEKGIISADPTLIQMAHDAAVQVLGEEHVHTGVIATGAQYVSSQDYSDQLYKKFNALAVEMEGGSIGWTAHLFNVPFVVLRGIADYATNLSNKQIEDLSEEAAEKTNDIVIKMLQNILDEKTF